MPEVQIKLNPLFCGGRGGGRESKWNQKQALSEDKWVSDENRCLQQQMKAHRHQELESNGRVTLLFLWSITSSSEQLVIQIMIATLELKNYKSLTFCNVEYLFSPRLRFSS